MEGVTEMTYDDIKLVVEYYAIVLAGMIAYGVLWNYYWTRRK
jgi:hypothetical protein